MSGLDLAEWEAFERAFGPIVVHERIDAAQAMASSVNARVGRARGDLRAVKFLPKWGEERREDQTADEMVDTLRRMARRRKPKKERRDN